MDGVSITVQPRKDTFNLDSYVNRKPFKNKIKPKAFCSNPNCPDHTENGWYIIQTLGYCNEREVPINQVECPGCFFCSILD